MATIKLTDRTVRALSTDRVQADFWDELVPGLGVRVSGLTARKTFIVRYRARDGKRPRYKLGTYPILGLKDAREEAKRVLARV
ncbi:MAG: Arm DNA-binding domain-containing protein, partial [Gemmatimonadota bacterium]